jgi:hypothetical protein
MSKFCGDCGNKLADGKCKGCTAKSVNGLSTESLEKSLQLLEDMAKGVRPGLAKEGKKDKRTPEQANDDAVDQLARHAKETETEGESTEEPETTKDVENAKFVKGFPGGANPAEYEDDEDDQDFDRDEDGEDEDNPRFPVKSAAKKTKKSAAKKSLADSLLGDKEVRNAVDVSGFLKSITDHLVEAIDSQTASVNKSLQVTNKSLEFASYQKGFNQVLAKSLVGLVEIIKSQNAEIVKLGGQPAGQRKSDLAAAPIEKSFNVGETPTGETLSKAQAAERLLGLRAAGDTSITSLDISRAESNGFLKPEHKVKLGIQ